MPVLGVFKEMSHKFGKRIKMRRFIVLVFFVKVVVADVYFLLWLLSQTERLRLTEGRAPAHFETSM